MAFGAPTFSPENIVAAEARAVIDQVFLKIINTQKQFKNSYEMIQENFTPDVPLTESETASLKQLLPPKIYSVKDGIAFEFDGHTGFKILRDQTGVIEAQDFSKVSRWSLLENSAYAQGWEEGLLIAGAVALARSVGVAIVRRITVQTMTRLAGQVAAGAVVGCTANIALQSGEQTPAQSCKNGAENGATLFLGGLGIRRLLASAIGGSALARLVTGIGVGGLLALLGETTVELGTMNSAILRCSGNDGGYILSTRNNGITGRTLYEYDGSKMTFYQSTKESLKEINVNPKSDELVKFFIDQKKFPGARPDALKLAADNVLLEVSKFSDECKLHKDGFTRRLWSAEGQKIDATPAKQETKSAI